MTQDDLIWRAEEACLNARPSPIEILLEGWLCRAAGGRTRRTNCANPLRGTDGDPTRIVAEVESLYTALGRSTVFRVPSFIPAMDPPLESLGYALEGETCTLFAALRTEALRDTDGTDLATTPSDAWFAARAALEGDTAAADHAYRRSIDTIVRPKAFASRRLGHETVAVAYGVLDRGLLVLNSVVTHPDHRQHGHGAQAVGRLMQWAGSHGASGACLQVVATNRPAQALYRSLGFGRELYRYHYRVKALASG